MKKFLYRLFSFLFPFITLLYLLDLFLSSNLSKSYSGANGEYNVWYDLYNGEINSDIVVYGASTAFIHINPQMLQDSLNYSAYNLGMTGEPFDIQYFRHCELLRYNRPPKLIILTLDNLSLRKLKHLKNPDQFLPFLYFNKNMFDYLRPYNEYSFTDYIVPLLRYKGREKAIKYGMLYFFGKNDDIYKRTRGYKAYEKTWEEKTINITSWEEKIDKNSIELLKTFLNECKNQNIQVIIVSPPLHPLARKQQPDSDSLYTFYHTLSLEYGITYFDYTKDTMNRNNQYFFDSYHLNKQGSTIYTNKIIKDIKKFVNIKEPLNQKQ